MRDLRSKIGALAVATFFCRECPSPGAGRGMVEQGRPLQSVAAHCRLPSIPRSTVSHRPADETAASLASMALIDRQVMATQVYGVRQMTWPLRHEGHAVNPKRVRRPMRPMSLMPIYRKPDTSIPRGEGCSPACSGA